MIADNLIQPTPAHPATLPVYGVALAPKTCTVCRKGINVGARIYALSNRLPVCHPCSGRDHRWSVRELGKMTSR